MSGYIEGTDRGQMTLFPDRLEDWIGEDNPVRVVDLFVDEVDLAELGFGRVPPALTGRPGYHPSVLLKLFIYGYLNRVPSSRALEREARCNVEVMWLTGRLAPDHKTIAKRAQRSDRIRQEIQRLRDMDRALQDAPDSQISLTDPDARSMATSARGSGFVGYNAQAAADTETHLIVTHDVINDGHDREQLSPIAKEARAALRRDEISVLAEKGYFSGREILACHEEGITTTLPRPGTSGNRKKDMYVKPDFACDADADVYRCPAGEMLTYRYTTEEAGLVIRRYWASVCQTCPLKARCTTGKQRRITPSHRCKQRLPGSGWEHEHLVEAMHDRMSRDPALMGLRRSTVEHPFGTIKAWMGATHFRMRRLRNVHTEMAFQVLAYNIKRMISLIGVRRLLAAIPALTKALG